MAALRKYEPPLDTIIMTRMAKIHTSSETWMAGSVTARRMKVMRATPVTP